MTTPAGWYDDGSGAQRYWDGSAWTDQVRPPPPAAPGPPPAYVPQASSSAARNGFSAIGKSRPKLIISGVGAFAAIAVIVALLATGGGSSGPADPSVADQLQSAYRTCSSTAGPDIVVASHLSYQGGALTIQVEDSAPYVQLLRCITDAVGAPQEFLNKLGQTTEASGQSSDTFKGIAASWSYENPSGYGGFINLQLYPATQ
jgi:hypothetical protein